MAVLESHSITNFRYEDKYYTLTLNVRQIKEES